jgi:predicted nucleic acid-binding protein
MKYYLDVNSIVHIIEKFDNQFTNNEDIFISRLTIDEMLKYLKKNYERQRSQFLFLKEKKIKIDWRFFETVTFLEPFGFNSILNYNIPYTKMSFDNILKYENYSEYCNDGAVEGTIEAFAKTSVTQMQDTIIKNYMDYFTLQLIQMKRDFQCKKECEIKKIILKQCLETGIKILKNHNIINNKIERKYYTNRGMKNYFSSKKIIDYYINTTVELLKNNEIKRNDGTDLYHLAYIDRNNNDIFVTDDNKLRNLCNKISNGSAISVEEFIKIINN